ncbi:MAG: CocE/NonD family hydrolase [Limisphaerales bacterium]
MQRSLRLSLALWFSALALVCAQAPASSTAKQTVMVPMRDGVKLGTDVYLPAGNGSFPVVLLRSPYNKSIGVGLGADGVKRGFAVVIQDTRGRFASEGENLPFYADAWGSHWDGQDTLEWLARQPWCNGRIGTFGGSALGITQLLMAGSGTTRLTCEHITVGAPSLYDHCVYPGGVFKKAMIEDWLRVSQFSTNALRIWTSHPDYDDYWRERDISWRYDKVNTPAVHIGGWFDIFTQGTIDAFVGYQTRGGPNARGKQKLVVGPWTHGVAQDKAGELTFPNAKHPPNHVDDSWRWFEHCLNGVNNGIEAAPAVTYYVMGDVRDPKAPGNVWRTANQWPPVPTTPTRFYFHLDRALSVLKFPRADSLAYDDDPRNPVPTVGGPQLTLPAGPMDQRKLENRPDVLLFTSEPLTEPLEVTGRVRVQLWAASDAPDTDFFAKLCDVYPDGRSFNVCEGQIRARFRDSFRREKPLKPGKVYPFVIDLWSTSIIFNRGHQLRVQVTSSSAPGYDPNPNTGAPFRSNDETRVAHNTIYLDGRHASGIVLPVATTAAAK